MLGICGFGMASAIAAPQALGFPHVAVIGATKIYAEGPIDLAKMARVLADADRRLRSSTLYDGQVAERVFLTDGGWRWHMLALGSNDAFALTRPVSDIVSGAIIVNKSSIAKNRITLRRDVGGTRSLSAIIAHERTHILVRDHFGLVASVQFPVWKNEGYADHVAGESSLSVSDVETLQAKGVDHPALPYFEGRRRVASVLAENGNDVEALFADY